ncbi:MAG: sialate O-acetylesterase [Treponema sp.]|nr:sialate O-acetylesterase [Treponema sp.]
MKRFYASLAVAMGLAVVLGGCASTEKQKDTGSEDTVLKDTVSKENFHIYLAFGQSNMVGYIGPTIGKDGNSGADTTWVGENGYDTPPANFVVMAAANDDNLPYGRQKGQWYQAVPPLNRAGNGINPADFLGRTIAEAVADKGIKVGVIVVAVDGVQINMFSPDVDGFKNYITSRADQVWERQQGHAYVDPSVEFPIPTADFVTEDYPYKRLVDLAKKAQEEGVIKGIIMHQGESGVQEGTGPYHEYVRKVYNSLCTDLGLEAGKVPFLAGEPVREDSLNLDAIRSIPEAFADIPNTAFVISSEGLTGWEPGNQEDGNRRIHFSFAGYEELGKRYGQKMLELLYQ